MIDKPIIVCLDAEGHKVAYYTFATKEDAERDIASLLPKLSHECTQYTITYGVMSEMYKFERGWSKVKEYVTEPVPNATAKAIEI